MKKVLFTTFFFMSLLFVGCKKNKTVFVTDLNNIKQKEQLVVFFEFENCSYIVYDNENEFFTRLIGSGLKNAKTYKLSIVDFLFSSKKDDFINGRYYFTYTDASGSEYSYETSSRLYIRDNKNNKEYKYNFIDEMNSYFAKKYFVDSFISEQEKDKAKIQLGIK